MPNPFNMINTKLAVCAESFSGDDTGIMNGPAAKILDGLVIFTDNSDDIRASKSANLLAQGIDIFEMFGFGHSKTPSLFRPSGA